MRLAEAFQAITIDATLESFIFQITGRTREIDRFISLMSHVGLVEVSRTGVAALKRGAEILQFGTNPSKSRTFRKGGIGGWKNSFDEKTEILFNDFVGTSLNDFMVNNKL